MCVLRAEKRKNAPEFDLMKFMWPAPLFWVVLTQKYIELNECKGKSLLYEVSVIIQLWCFQYGGCHKTMFFGDFEESKLFIFLKIHNYFFYSNKSKLFYSIKSKICSKLHNYDIHNRL